MLIKTDKWKAHTITSIFNFTSSSTLEVGSELAFAGDNTNSNKLNGIWSPGTVRLWLSTKGKWERKIVFPETDEQLIRSLENDINKFFPSEAFTSLDKLFNDKDSIVFDYQNNEVRWDWYPGKSVDEFLFNSLNTHVFKYPFKQKVVEESDFACLMINANPEDVGTQWDCGVISTDIKDVAVEKEGNECWFVSCFEDMETNTGKAIKTGKFYKMSSDLITLNKTENHNRILKIVKK